MSTEYAIHSLGLFGLEGLLWILCISAGENWMAKEEVHVLLPFFLKFFFPRGNGRIMLTIFKNIMELAQKDPCVDRR